MIRLIWRLCLMVMAGLAIMWLAEKPGQVTVQWLGRDIHFSVLVAVFFVTAIFFSLALLYWAFKKLFGAPRAMRERLRERRTRKAYQSLSRGIIAAGAGDGQSAARHAALAAETLKSEPLVKLLEAQAAQLRGDKEQVKRVFDGMASSADTELLGLRGLFSQARDSGDWTAARQHAETAYAKNRNLPWASTAVLQSLLVAKEWHKASEILAQQAKSGLLPKPEAAKKQAALLTAAAIAIEETLPSQALTYAAEAHALDGKLVPASMVLARQYLASDNVRKAKKVLQATWNVAPHRDLALLYGLQRGGSKEEQFERVRDLVGHEPVNLEGCYALGKAAVAAQRFDVARAALRVQISESPSAGICALMAEIENAGGDQSASREWLARAFSAPRDPLWVSDGVASHNWVAISPATAEISPSEWKIPFEQPVGGWLQFQNAPPALLQGIEKTAARQIDAPRAPDDPGIEQES